MSRLENDQDRLATLPPTELREAWRDSYHTDAPMLAPALLRQGIAYALQEKSFGKLPACHARMLARRGGSGVLTPKVSVGTQLVRSWNGRTLSVVATNDGFTFEDRNYRSLSAIAREVTGTAW